MVENQDGTQAGNNPAAQKVAYGDRILAVCGYALVMVGVFSFGAVVAIKLWGTLRGGKGQVYASWIDLVQQETGTIALVVIGVVAATLGKRLLTTVRLADARTIPYEDLPLIQQAVIDGKSEPIDQYVRLRSLSGMSGNFTKLGITGLPLTTVGLTLIFSFISLMPIPHAETFLDLTKLTLGAFIGSFVQRQVEQRRQDNVQGSGPSQKPEMLA